MTITPVNLFLKNLFLFSKEFFSLHTLKGLKCVHINTRNLYPKIEEIKLIVDKTGVDCISINESMLDHTIADSEISINNFALFRTDRTRHGGGVALCIKSVLNPCILNMQFSTEEAVWVKIKLKNKNVIIESMYRTPNSPSAYYEV